jgi:hypothetical protein
MKLLTRDQRLQLASQPVVQPQSVASPVKGWNTRDALDAMDPLDAVTLDNWYPDAGGCVVRNGFASFATGVGSAPVKTLAEFNASATRKLIAAASGNFYDISAGGAAGAALATGFASDQWQTESFLSRTFFANGVDTAQVYDGTSFANAAFTGVTLSTLIGWRQYQQRLFAWANNSTGFYFAPLNSISGALSFYDLSAYAPRGGNVIAATTFSHDGGNGVQDYIAFMMSSGDVIMFFGNDPSNANNWTQIGRYRLGAPVSARAVCNYGAEAFLTTADDHVPLQQQLVALKLGQLPPRSKVSTAVQAAVKANSSAFGWQALYYPRGRRLIFNVPNPDGSFDQHVCNTGVVDPNGINPWCRFRNMPAYCWGLYKDALYFGAAGGIVYAADTGNLDNLGPVNAVAQQAWNTFEDPQRKRATAARPVISTMGAQGITFSLGFDYGDLAISDALVISAVGSPWDISPWDTSPWSSEANVTTQWHIAGGQGTAIGIGLKVAANNPVLWMRTDLKFEEGQAL